MLQKYVVSTDRSGDIHVHVQVSGHKGPRLLIDGQTNRRTDGGALVVGSRFTVKILRCIAYIQVDTYHAFPQFEINKICIKKNISASNSALIKPKL